MAGISVSKHLQPGAISVSGGPTRALISDLQLLTPQSYKKYVEKYGNEEFFMWLATYGGQEIVKNREFQWFESRGKLMPAVTPAANVAANTAGASVVVTLASGDHFSSGTASPVRVGETVRIASTGVEAEIIAVNKATPSAHTFTIRPKKAAQALNSNGSVNLLATDAILFGGLMDVGEASVSRDPLDHPDVKETNTTTEMRESWAATDRAEMTEVFYNSGVSGSVPNGGNQAGTSLYTLKGLKKANTRFLNNMELKLMRGNTVDNTGLNTTTSVGTQGLVPRLIEDAPGVTYTAGTLNIAKLHEITRLLDVNGGAVENLWLMDIFQRQEFSDTLFAAYPAGAFVWGEGERSEEAALHYGVQSIKIDSYLFKVKKHKQFNAEVTTGKSPFEDYYRSFGIICPQGVARNAKGEAGDVIKNLTIMSENPVEGGTTGNGIRVWQHGGGSRNPSNGTMEDKVEMIAYKGVRVAAANQFLVVQGPTSA